jgi:ribosomal protein L21E
MEKPLTALVNAISEGRYDKQLDGILTSVNKAIRYRRSVLAEELVSELAEGDRVRVKPKANIKPRYFLGRVGTIDHFEGTIVWIKLDTAIVRNSKTIGKVGVQPYDLEKVE